MARAAVVPDLLDTINQVGGRNPEDRFRWLVGVAARDLKDASEADLNALRWQMLAFAVSGRHDLAPDATAGSLWGPTYAQAVRKLHGQLRAGFQELRTKHQFTLPKPVIDRAVWRPTAPDIVPVNTHDVAQRFWAAVVALLMGVGPRLRICENPTCARFFLSTRPKQLYCRPGCSQYIRTARFRKSHAEKVREWKHHAYARRRKRLLGPNVKVTRRPRRKSSGETSDAHARRDR